MTVPITSIAAISTLPTRPRIVPMPVRDIGKVGEVTVSAGGWEATPVSSSIVPILVIAAVAFLFLKKG